MAEKHYMTSWNRRLLAARGPKGDFKPTDEQLAKWKAAAAGLPDTCQECGCKREPAARGWHIYGVGSSGAWAKCPDCKTGG